MIFHEYLMHIRQEEILAEAARAGLVAPKSQQPKPKCRFYAPVLNQLGNQLCNWEDSSGRATAIKNSLTHRSRWTREFMHDRFNISSELLTGRDLNV